MILTLVLFGLAFGRWWRLSLVAAAFAWPVALVLAGAMEVGWGLISAMLLAFSNTLAGVLVHQGALCAVRRARPGSAVQPQ